MTQPQFKLFKVPRDAMTTTRDAYAGHVIIKGEVWLIEAHVVDHQFGDQVPGKHFEGTAVLARAAPERLLRGAKVIGAKAAIPPEHLVMAELPFDDPIPKQEGI